MQSARLQPEPVFDKVDDDLAGPATIATKNQLVIEGMSAQDVQQMLRVT